MGIPVPDRLTPEEIDACERFSLFVFGVLMFDREPSHNGRHGYACEQCLPVLAARDEEAARIRAIPQPWDLQQAA